MNIHINKQVIVRNLGLGDYKEIWDYQETIFKETVDEFIYSVAVSSLCFET